MISTKLAVQSCFHYVPALMEISTHIRAFAALFSSVLVLFIALGSGSAHAFFWEGDGLCGQSESWHKTNTPAISWISSTDLEEVVEDATPCSDPEAPLNEADFSVCFKDAGAPMSTLPEAIAEMQSERATAHIAQMAMGLANRIHAENAPRSETPEPRAELPRYALVKPPTQECASYEIECESAPSPLILISLELQPPVQIESRPEVHFAAPLSVKREGPMSPHNGPAFIWTYQTPPTPPPNA